MGRASVRSAIYNYFNPNGTSAVTGIDTWYPSFPKRIPATAFRSTPGQTSGSAAAIFILAERENRIALGGAHSGWKRVVYTVEVQIFHNSIEQHAEDAMDHFDLTIDNLKNKIRADRNLGTNLQVVWEAGEGELSSVYGEPKVIQGGATEIWGTVRFQLTEMVNA